MKKITVIAFALVFLLNILRQVNAQSVGTIWLATTIKVYQVGDIVTVTVNANSPIQVRGFNFQIRYEPACLKVMSITSPIPMVKGSLVQHTYGVMDAAFTSESLQTADGELAEIRLLALDKCSTNLVLESAALIVKSGTGKSSPLSGITFGQKDVIVNINGNSLDTGVASSEKQLPIWVLALFISLAFSVVALITINLFRKPASSSL